MFICQLIKIPVDIYQQMDNIRLLLYQSRSNLKYEEEYLNKPGLVCDLWTPVDRGSSHDFGCFAAF